MSYLIDTNVLLRFFDLTDPRNPDVVAALDAITSASTETYVCAQVLIEYWVAATRPRQANGLGLTAEQVDDNIAEIETLLECLPEPPDMARRWLERVKQYSVLGVQAHDARIAALMQAHGVTHIVTLNSADFARYRDITAVSPGEVANP